ncbi:hypothetical protein HYO29_22585 [Vibrio parahaemolyticus]|nr:hypothetical protein [Vibrio parahaemolyticus]
MNPIKKIIQSRINSLKELSTGFDAIQHNTTKGTLRENGLIEFFKSIVPQKLSISSGIICDSLDGVSNQTDFIVYNKEVLPSLFLSSEISLIPIDSVYLTAEVKSTLSKKDLEQIGNARSNFNTLRISSLDQNTNVKIPTVVLAYSTSVAESTLIDWMKEQQDVVSICVIDRFTLSRESGGVKKYVYSKESEFNDEVLTFSSQLFEFLSTEIEKGKPKANWEAYIIGAKEFADKRNLKIS